MCILTADFHTHILPGIDDGSQTVEDSVEMLRREQLDGVGTVYLTPHFYPQHMYPDMFLEKRQLAISQLHSALNNVPEMLQLVFGAEVLYYPGMSQWEQLEALTLGDSRYILIEMPSCNWSESTYTELQKIRAERGLIPIIAHIERNLTRFNMQRVLNRLSNIPVLLQMNSDYLLDTRTRRTALKMIAEHKIQLISSDCHSPGWRSPNMAKTREVLLSNIDKQTHLFLANTQHTVTQK